MSIHDEHMPNGWHTIKSCGGGVMKKYTVIPGYVISRTDGEEHYVGASALMRLYGVSPSECVVIQEDDPWGPKRGTTILRPRYDGDYSLPAPPEPGERDR